MSNTFIPLSVQKEGGDAYASTKTVSLNPALVLYASETKTGSVISYQIDKGVVREYEATDTLAEISARSGGFLVVVPLVDFGGSGYATPKNVLLNTALVSTIAEARNHALNDNSHSLITYNREGKLNEQFTAALDTTDLASLMAGGEWQGTQEEYDALGSYNPRTTYYIL